MDLLIVAVAGFLSGLGIEWFGTYLVYRTRFLPLGKIGLVVRFAVVLLLLVVLAFAFDFLLGSELVDADKRNLLGRVVLLAFSGGIAIRVLVRRFRG